ncbi:dsRBD fold-containing protein [Saccharopolyspora oryzae]|uniref:dsRBD fold-containing protein n=1 Tax=Saccharopolyspora oryzae TaxID=2997343 RepID=UPI0022EA6FD7|nr:dsRBD fold-containing protein [Saccharopolyspora oryzae]
MRTRDATDLQGKGVAKRNPDDTNVPEIGAEQAAARALFELAHHLLRAATDDVEQLTGEPAHLHS